MPEKRAKTAIIEAAIINGFKYLLKEIPELRMAYDFSYEKFIDNSLSYKITARNIRWVSEDSLYRLNDYFKRTFKNDRQLIESKRIKDTIFSFKIDELSSLTNK